MKSLLLTLAVLASFAARAGGSAEGGGNTVITLSSAAQVTKALAEAKQKFFDEFRSGSLRTFIPAAGYYGNLRPVMTEGQPARLVEIINELENLVGHETLHETVLRKLKDIPFDLKAAGPCLTADGSHTEGAVDLRDPNSPICFSVERLQQVPSSLLKMQALGLVAHEYMHKLGYGEADAYLVQMYFIAEVGTELARNRQESGASLLQLRSSVTKVRQALARKNAADACQTLVDMRKTTTYLADLIGEHQRQEGFAADLPREISNPSFRVFNSLKIESLDGVSNGRYGQWMTIEADQAFCAKQASADRVLKQLAEADRIYAMVFEALPRIFAPGLTLKP